MRAIRLLVLSVLAAGALSACVYGGPYQATGGYYGPYGAYSGYSAYPVYGGYPAYKYSRYKPYRGYPGYWHYGDRRGCHRCGW